MELKMTFLFVDQAEELNFLFVGQAEEELVKPLFVDQPEAVVDYLEIIL